MEDHLRHLGRNESVESDPSSSAKVLNAKVHAGVLDINRIKLAARLGDSVARVFLDDSIETTPSVIDEPETYQDFCRWLKELLRDGDQQIELNIAIEITRLVFEEWKVDHPDNSWLPKAVNAAEEFYQDPNDETAKKARDAASEAREIIDQMREQHDYDVGTLYPGEVAQLCSSLASGDRVSKIYRKQCLNVVHIVEKSFPILSGDPDWVPPELIKRLESIIRESILPLLTSSDEMKKLKIMRKLSSDQEIDHDSLDWPPFPFIGP